MYPVSTFAHRSGGYHHGDLRAELVRAAGALLDEGGPAGMTLRAAARRAGVSHAAPYRHFPSREALLTEVALEGFGRLAAALREAAAGGGRAVAEAYVRFALSQPRRFRLMFAAGSTASAGSRWRDAMQDMLRAFAPAFAGLAPAQEAQRAAAAAWALVHGLAQLMLDERVGPPASDPEARQGFVGEVLGAVRFAIRAQPGQSAMAKLAVLPTDRDP
jgi:AcrR family transcriptional regulator